MLLNNNKLKLSKQMLKKKLIKVNKQQIKFIV